MSEQDEIHNIIVNVIQEVCSDEVDEKPKAMLAALVEFLILYEDSEPADWQKVNERLIKRGQEQKDLESQIRGILSD